MQTYPFIHGMPRRDPTPLSQCSAHSAHWLQRLLHVLRISDKYLCDGGQLGGWKHPNRQFLTFKTLGLGVAVQRLEGSRRGTG